MLKKMILVFTLSFLCGCSGYIRESSFIAQDKEVTNYLSSDIEEWKKLFPEHKLKPLKLLTKNDSIMLQGLYLEHNKSQDVIFFIPGNGMKISEGGIDALRTMAKLERSIVIFDRRGLGASGGKATISSLIDDSIEQYLFIKNELHASAVIVHGFSLGSFIAGQLAKNKPIDALVLQGSATNVDDWIDKSVPWYTKPFLTIEIDEVFKSIDNRIVVSDYYKGPLFVIGAENDEQVPVELSELLFNSSKSSNKELLVVENANHGNMLENSRELLIYKKFLASVKSL
ncbi:alpha/beta hydrolase [Colwellia sp. MB02u-10]|jgi:pimeloyl-ACP methyl ester carboxylesterase|uniref:alpha/beta hydrolase n=1 Tax=Colwellia sp. MB02u-10 TaxID=2759828 RepID=UPI0015F4F373|nr:alpha/beta fold hydrolase [Colwellia sp. MB02u-10]MBA6340967.1 alpha/beta hydrolase [Colwellia sp. MB02u-10]